MKTNCPKTHMILLFLFGSVVILGSIYMTSVLLDGFSNLTIVTTP